MKGRTLFFALVVGILVMAGAVAYGLFLTDAFQPRHASDYELEAIDEPREDRPLVAIEPGHVQGHAQQFYGLLEDAYRNGRSHTQDFDTKREIRDYLMDLTGTSDTSIQISYRDAFFNLTVSVQ